MYATSNESCTLSLHDALPISRGGVHESEASEPERAERHRRGEHESRPERVDQRPGCRPCGKRRDGADGEHEPRRDRKSTRLNSSHVETSYAVLCLKKKKLKKI